MKVVFNCPELDTALKNLSRYNNRQAAKVEEAVSKSTKAIRKGAAGRINDETGYLRKHMTSRFDLKNCIGTIRAGAPHAHLVEYGHKGWPVKPKKKKAMKIKGEFVASANQKAVSAHPFMRPAYEDEKPHLLHNLAEAVKA